MKKRKYLYLLALLLVVLSVTAFILYDMTWGSDMSERLDIQPFLEGHSICLNRKVHVPNGMDETTFSISMDLQELLGKLHRDNENLSSEVIGWSSNGAPRYLLSFHRPDSHGKDYFGLAYYSSFRERWENLSAYSLLDFVTRCSLIESYEYYSYILFPTLLVDYSNCELDDMWVVQGEKYPVIRLAQQSGTPEEDVMDFICDFYSGSPWYEVERVGANECAVTFDRTKTGYTDEWRSKNVEVPFCDFSIKAERTDGVCYLTVDLEEQ